MLTIIRRHLAINGAIVLWHQFLVFYCCFVFIILLQHFLHHVGAVVVVIVW
jgi:hypothetical protein